MLLAARTWGQTATSGAIAGTVKDATGAVLPGVSVTAASPALIEKERTVITDEGGSYKILELRPGTYTVTFTLAGFATVKREGILLTVGFTAPANAELRVGGLEETVTVSGASPVVDVQNARSQKVLNEETLNALPTGKMTNGFLALTLGAVQGGQVGLDLGGSRGEASTQVSIHGSRGDDLRRMIDGMNFNMLEGNAGGQNVTFRVSNVGMQEIVLEGQSTAETETTGNINYIPKDGGNKLSLIGNAAYTNDKLQASNLDDALRARGATTPTSVRKIYDYGVGVGGPIRTDHLWFYSATRYWGAQNVNPGAFYDKTQNTLFYSPDPGNPAFEDQWNRETSIRLTWQVGAKHKLTYTHFFNKNCNCVENVSATVTPAAADSPHNGLNNFSQTTWTHPRTNRLLFTAGAAFGFFPIAIPYERNVSATDIGITDVGTGISYHARAPGATGYNVTNYGSGFSNNFSQRFSAAYVTGSHAFKVGEYSQEGDYVYNAFTNQALAYTFRLGVPTSLSEYVSPFNWELKYYQLGIYAQDQWTLQRMTVNLGVRADQFNGHVPATHLAAGRFNPAFDFPEVTDAPSFQDISPRLGVAYDLFGNGKTAVKGSFGRYLVGQATGTTKGSAPVFQMVQVASRTWNDANANLTPDCDLMILTANGECGAISNTAFGTQAPTTFWQNDVLRGFAIRPYDWQTSVSLQQELRPGIALNVGYFRTSFQNFTVTDNTRIAPADFTQFCVTTPSDARLGAASGQTECGLYDLNPNRFGIPANNIVTAASHYTGVVQEIYNGFDVAISARFGRGGQLSGGVSSGRQDTWNCLVIDSPQNGRPGFCNPTPPWAAGTQVKLNGTYPLPYGIQVSVVYQNLPGAPMQANLTYTNAQVAASLGRNLAGCPATGTCTATVSVPILPLQTKFENRPQQIDMRFTKSIRVGRTSLKGNLDLYNLVNDNTVLAANPTYGPAWLQPLQAHGGRLFKFGGEVSF
jgi:hypothetical protein